MDDAEYPSPPISRRDHQFVDCSSSKHRRNDGAGPRGQWRQPKPDDGDDDDPLNRRAVAVGGRGHYVYGDIEQTVHSG